ncbi:MAG: hypothetical protein LGR52_07865 [Candidatus Thiosymbion ectosymbiont of Robbea hypermnestra]|nr:hypothetical protein [Candidatus Thiosymbion ectosymbiont of Robbea hypermnestra]
MKQAGGGDAYCDHAKDKDKLHKNNPSIHDDSPFFGVEEQAGGDDAYCDHAKDKDKDKDKDKLHKNNPGIHDDSPLFSAEEQASVNRYGRYPG